MRQPILIAILVTACIVLTGRSASAAESPQDILIVANKSVPVESISLGDLKDIFLLKRGSWNGVVKAVPVHQPDKSAIRGEFRARVLQLSEAEESRHWENQKIRAGVSKPVAFGNPLRAVFSMRGAVGYVYRSEYKDGVAKILAVIPATK